MSTTFSIVEFADGLAATAGRVEPMCDSTRNSISELGPDTDNANAEEKLASMNE